MKKTERKENMEIEGIVLTPELIEYIKDMQENDNEQANSQREFIADIICMIGKTLNEIDGEEKDYAAEMICCLCHMRDRFKKLMKPFTNTKS